ncbi:MAG: inositol monophosphatase family protein, partial [Chloroflexota bacterium]|nr:inositol monophosphatase family protein [Chloroflexota bacterium]
LQREYPDFALLTEESGGTRETSGYRWIVDPLDGTRNYILGIPFFAVNLALTLGDEVVLAVTYSPCHNELFRAQRGAGAFLNDVPFSVSQRETLEDAVLGFEAGYDDEKARQGLRLASQIWPGVQALRMMGSAALGLAYTACGRIDLYFHHYVFPWDVAPGILLVQEAGGVITDRVGKPIDLKERELGLIASNQALHAQFLRRVRRHPWQRA